MRSARPRSSSWAWLKVDCSWGESPLLLLEEVLEEESGMAVGCCWVVSFLHGA